MGFTPDNPLTPETMYETLTISQVADALLADENASWSYSGARALAEYLEDYEDQTGESLEFDRVAIRCDFSEYETAVEAAEECGFEGDEEASLEWLQERTTAFAFTSAFASMSLDNNESGVIVAAF